MVFARGPDLAGRWVSRLSKNSLAPTGKSPLGPRAIPRPKRGAYRDRHGRWARDAMAEVSRGRRAREFSDGEVVWSWRPDAGVKPATIASAIALATVAKEPGHRGEHEGNR